MPATAATNPLLPLLPDTPPGRGATWRGVVGWVLVLLLAVGMGLYIIWVFEPTYVQERTDQGFTTGQYSSDLYPSWYATYETLWHGRNPYTPAITAEIQQDLFGRVLGPQDKEPFTFAFEYPLYIVFLLAPTTLLPFLTLMPFLTILMGGLIVASVMLWGAALGWQPRWPVLLALGLLALLTIPGYQALTSLQPTVLAVVLLAAGAAALARQRLLLAGALLAGATIKPQVGGVMLAVVLAWALFAPRQRGLVLVGFAGTLGVLVIGALLLQPGWPVDWLLAVGRWSQYHAAQPTFLGVWLPWPPLATGVLVGGGGALLAWGWAVRHAAAGSLAWSVLLAFAGLYNVLFLPSGLFYNHLLLFPAGLLIIQQGSTLRARGRAGRWAYGCALFGILAPWIAATGLLLAWGVTNLRDGPAAAASVAHLWVLPWATSLLPPLALLPTLLVLARYARQAVRPATMTLPAAHLAHQP